MVMVAVELVEDTTVAETVAGYLRVGQGAELAVEMVTATAAVATARVVMGKVAVAARAAVGRESST